MNLKHIALGVVSVWFIVSISQGDQGGFVDSCCAKNLQPSLIVAKEREQASSGNASEATGGIAERSIEINYQFTIRNLPDQSEKVIVWVPLPPSNAQQRLEDFRLDPPLAYTIVTEPEYGNQFIYLNLTEVASASVGDLAVSATFRINREAYIESDGVQDDLNTSQNSLARFLVADRLIPVDGVIAKEAQIVAGNVENPLAQARRLYEHVVESVTYDKSGVGWGQGNALYACDVRAGNCTDFHSLFIGESRSLGIPARFIMGMSLPEYDSEGIIPGYHCWAEFYVEGKGWLPIDASEASKFPEKKESFFAGLDEHRVQFTTGRDIQLPGSSAPPLNYVIYPHVEVEGETYANVETTFYYREIGNITENFGG